MNRVTTEQEALEICKEYQCNIKFWKSDSFNKIPAHVDVELGFNNVKGKDLVEAVNRMSELYHTAPVYFEELSWWEENENYNNPSYWRNKVQSQ